MQFATLFAALATMAASVYAAPTGQGQNLAVRDAAPFKINIQLGVGVTAIEKPSNRAVVGGTGPASPWILEGLSTANPSIPLSFEIGANKTPLQCLLSGTQTGVATFQLNKGVAEGCTTNCPLPTSVSGGVTLSCTDLAGVMKKAT